MTETKQTIVPERMKNLTTWQGQILDWLLAYIRKPNETNSEVMPVALEQMERIEPIVLEAIAQAKEDERERIGNIDLTGTLPKNVKLHPDEPFLVKHLLPQIFTQPTGSEAGEETHGN